MGRSDREHHRLEIRRRTAGHGPLRVTGIAAAKCAERSVEPRLLRNPVECGASVRRFVGEWNPASFRSEAPACALHHDVIAALGEALYRKVADGGVEFGIVRRETIGCTDQD